MRNRNMMMGGDRVRREGLHGGVLVTRLFDGALRSCEARLKSGKIASAAGTSSA